MSVSLNKLAFIRGVLFGGVVGDCYGYVYEDKATVTFDVPSKLLTDTLNCESKSQLIYTDDTQMGLAILQSVRTRGGLDVEHLAKKFADDYFTDGAHRYYGGTVIQLFSTFRIENYKEPFKFAAKLFNNTGSFGNGGAMRAAHAALYALTMSDADFDNFVSDVTRITHAHPLAICGALMQANAIKLVYQHWTHKRPIDPLNFLIELQAKVFNSQVICVHKTDPAWKSAVEAYKTKMSKIQSLLTRTDEPTVKEIVRLLGNNLEAIKSVPTALFVFLRSLQPISGIPFESIPLRCLVYAIGLGGDTDSIGTMACSLAGGYVGLDDPIMSDVIPKAVIERCEGWQTIQEYAVWLNQRH